MLHGRRVVPGGESLSTEASDIKRTEKTTLQLQNRDMGSNPEERNSIHSRDVEVQVDGANSDTKFTEKTSHLQNLGMDSDEEKNENCNLSSSDSVEILPSPAQRVIPFGTLTAEEFEEEKKKRNINTKEKEKKLETCYMSAWKILRFFSKCINVPCEEQIEMFGLALPKDATELRPRTQEELNDCVIVQLDDDDEEEELCSASGKYDHFSRVGKRSPQSQSLNEVAKRVRTEPESDGEFTDDCFDSKSESALQFSEPNDELISE